MPTRIGRFGPLVLMAVAGCGGGAARAVAPPPPVPRPAPAAGPLEIRVVYPPPQVRNAPLPPRGVAFADSTYTMPAVDSVFLFGSVGRGDARLSVNGRRVEVYPTGAWLAWLPRPPGPVFRLMAWTDADTVRATYRVRGEEAPLPPVGPVWIDPAGFGPVGDLWVRPGEGYRLRARASADARVRALSPGGDTLVLHPATPGDAGSGQRYEAWHAGPFGPDPGHVLAPIWRPPGGDSAWTVLEVIRRGDTARMGWPLRVGVVEEAVPPLARVDDDTAGTGATDGVLAGRPVPFGTYHWFFPNGTVARVSGRANDQVRLQLSEQSVAWVNATDVVPLRPGTPLPRAVAGSMWMASDSGSVTLHIPLSHRVPIRVDETERSVILRLYGAAADMDWIRYRQADPFVRLVSFAQPTEDEVEIRVDLLQAVWGYRTRWSGTELLLEIRRPPPLDPADPLRGRRIVVDPGHPPAGARGPTGITEAEVTLAVGRKLRALLEERGAQVVMTRDTDRSVDLIARTDLAEASGADVLVSLHANALADGLNPLANSGTTVFYYHPRSVALAREVQSALVRQFGFRDLGIARGDLHLARPTWMPAVLVEGLFMMVPEQEAVLAGEEGQWRYARGVLQGIERFLAARGAAQRARDGS